MNRSKRRSLQLQQTVSMKLAVLEKQKEDITEIINDYAAEVTAKARELLDDNNEQDTHRYQDVLQSLDKASERLTQIAIKLDTILDESEEHLENIEEISGDSHCSTEKSGAKSPAIPTESDRLDQVKADETGDMKEASPSRSKATSSMTVSSASEKSAADALSTSPMFVPTQTSVSPPSQIISQTSVVSQNPTIPVSAIDYENAQFSEPSLLSFPPPAPVIPASYSSYYNPQFNQLNQRLITDAITNTNMISHGVFQFHPTIHDASRGMLPLVQNNSLQYDSGLSLPLDFSSLAGGAQRLPLYRSNTFVPSIPRLPYSVQPDLPFILGAQHEQFIPSNSLQAQNFQGHFQNQFSTPSIMNIVSPGVQTLPMIQQQDQLLNPYTPTTSEAALITELTAAMSQMSDTQDAISLPPSPESGTKSLDTGLNKSIQHEKCHSPDMKSSNSTSLPAKDTNDNQSFHQRGKSPSHKKSNQSQHSSIHSAAVSENNVSHPQEKSCIASNHSQPISNKKPDKDTSQRSQSPFKSECDKKPFRQTSAYTDLLLENVKREDGQNSAGSKKEDVSAAPHCILRLKLEKDEILAAVVSNIEHPWSFHVQPKGILRRIQKDIKELILDVGTTRPHMTKPGHFYLAKSSQDNEYHRAKVLSVHENEDQTPEAKVVFVDYGNSATIPASDICCMPHSLTKYPSQALFCALSGVCPKNTENLWTEEAILLFQHFTIGHQVQLRTVHPSNEKAEKPMPHIVGITVNAQDLPKGVSKDIKSGPQSLANLLINKGYAKAIDIEEQIASIKNLSMPAQTPPPPGRLKDLDTLISSLKSQSQNKEKEKSLTPVPKSSPLPMCFQKLKSKPPKTNLLAEMSLASSPESKPSAQKTDMNMSSAEGTRKISPETLTYHNFSLDVDKQLHSLGKAMKQALRRVEKKYNMDSLELSSQESDSESVGGICDTTAPSIGSDGSTEGTEVEFKVMVSSVISPNSFFVHQANKESGHTFETLERKLSSYAKYTESALAELSTSFTPQKNTLCCARFSQDNNFYRGLVLDINLSGAAGSEASHGAEDKTAGRFLIFFIDYGDFEWVERLQLFPLHNSVKAVTPMVLWCTLCYVKPKDTQLGDTVNADEVSSWSVEAVDQFKSLVCGEKLLSAVVSEAALQKVNDMASFQLEPLPIYLLDRSMDGEEICLNHELLHLGFASLSVSQPKHKSTLDRLSPVDTDLQDWDPMKEEFTSIRNSYKVNTDDPGVALVGYSSDVADKERRRVCVYYNRPRGCYRGDRCPNLHIKVARNDITYDKVPVNIFEEDQSDLLPEPNTMVAVTVSMVMTPSHFYVTLPWGRLTLNQVHDDPELVHQYLQEETLEGLMLNMQEYYKDKPHYDGDLTLLAPGQAMAAQIRGQWMRVKVIDTDVESSVVEVMSVDFGNVDWVNENDLRELDLRFIHLSPQAVECTLVDLEPTDESGQWTEKACMQMVELVQEKVLAAWVKYRYPSGRISICLYDTSGETDVDINKQLVDLGVARISEKKQSSSQSQVEEAQKERKENENDRHREMTFMPG